MLILLLSACNLEHNHSKSDWRYSETHHWRVPECDRENCAIEDIVYSDAVEKIFSCFISNCF